jgi:HlyD family secretion protein
MQQSPTKHTKFLSVLLTLFSVLAGCTTDPPAIDTTSIRTVIDSRQVAAQGKLLPASGIISLSAIPGDQIESIFVKSGQVVSQGDVLVLMRSNQIRQIELQAAEARLEDAKAQLAAKQTEVQLAYQAAELKVTSAELAAKQSKRALEVIADGQLSIHTLKAQLDRLKKLRDDPQLVSMIGQSDIDLKEIELQKAQQTYKATYLEAEQASESAAIAVQLAKQALNAADESRKLVDSSKSIDALDKQIELLRVQVEMTRIIAPSDGTVLAVRATVGETAGPIPIIDLGDLSQMVCVAEVHEADVARISIGDKAVLTSAALPSMIEGTVMQIDTLVGSPEMRLPNPLARSDFRAVPVRIKIEQSQEATAAKLVQLQVDVTISPKATAASSESKTAS